MKNPALPLGKVEAKETFDLNEFLKRNSPIISAVALILTILGVLWAAHKTLSDLSYRQGQLEGQMKLLLQEREDLLKYYFQK